MESEELRRIRDLISKVDEVTRQSEQLRRHLSVVGRRDADWPPPQPVSRLFAESPGAFASDTPQDPSESTE